MANNVSLRISSDRVVQLVPFLIEFGQPLETCQKKFRSTTSRCSRVSGKTSAPVSRRPVHKERLVLYEVPASRYSKCLNTARCGD